MGDRPRTRFVDTMAYRNSLAALRERIAQLHEQIDEREAPLTELLLSELGREQRRELEALRRASPARRQLAAEEQAAEQLDALKQHLALLEEIHRQAPALESAYNALPDDVELALLGEPKRLPWLAQAPMDGVWALQQLPVYVRRLDEDAEINDAGARRFVLDARLRHDGVPLVMRLQPHVQHRSYEGELELVLATTVRRSAPALDLQPLAWMHALTTRLRIHRDASIGDDEFDHRFLIQAEQTQAARLLPPRVRTDLLRIARFDVPQLRVDGGKAVLRWRYDCTLEPIEAGARILAHLRSLDPHVRLLRS